MPNITTAIFGSGDNVARALPNLWQWDRGAKLVIEGLDLPTSYAVHFSNSPSGYDENEGSQLGDATGVTIPDEMLQAGLPIYAWIWLATTTSAATAAQVVIQINQRVMPPDYHPSTSQETIIDEAIAALNAAVDGLEYLSVEAETLEPGEPATVTKIHNENSGEVTLVFGIPQGDQGEAGPQGVQGETGPQGPQGVQGETGPAATDAQVEAAVNIWLGNNVAQETGYVLDSTLTMSNAAAPADKVGDLKSATNEKIGDVVNFNETLGYILPSFTNSDFVPGMYANGSWRGDGNYAKSRTIHELIPLDDFVVTAETETYTGLVLTLSLWNSSNQYLSSYKVGGPNGTSISMSNVIQTGSYEFFKSEALNTNENAAYITVSVGKLVSNAWADLPTDLVLKLRKTDGTENVLSKIGEIQTAINNSGGVIRLTDLQTFAWGKFLTSTGELSNSSAHKVVFTKIKNVKRITVNLAQNAGAIIGIIRDSEDNIVATLQRIYYYGEPYQFDISLNTDEEYTLYLNFFSYATVPNPFYDRITLYYSNPVDYAKPEVSKIARDTAVMLPRHSVFKPFDFNGKTAAFFGDSITVGVINADGSQVTTHNYPNEFSAKVGLTHTNKAVSGARIYVPSGISAAKILTQLQSVTLSNYDFIFIAGGINDFLAYTVDQMLIGLTELITYVKANYTGDVIWITPINTAKNVADVYNNKKDLNDYISAMTKLIKESDSNYQFSVVQGWEFGFPTLDSDSAYKNAMFGDGELHPSELGYNTLYVPGLLTALC